MKVLMDANYQMINVNNLNKSSVLSRIIEYSVKEFHKQTGKDARVISIKRVEE